MEVGELCSSSVLPCQGSILLQPDCRVCHLVLSGCSSSKVLGKWPQSGTGACCWPKGQPSILALLSVDVGAGLRTA